MTKPLPLPSVDVCVVGGGPAGIAATLALNGAGRSVLLVESGAEGSSAEAQELNAGETLGEPYAGLMATRHRRLGGTVNIWNVEVGHEPGAKYVPLSPGDLASWPLDFHQLEPWYVEAQALCGLGPFAYDADPWTTPSRPPFDLHGTGLCSAVYQFGPAQRFTAELPAELRRREGVTVVPRTTAVGFAHDDGAGRVSGVRIVGADGVETVVRARAVVLACGAVENARLLMLGGVAEGTEWLGRGFMEHARDFSLALEPYDRGVFRTAGFYDLHRADDGTAIGGRLAPTPGALAHHDLLNASITLVPRGRPIPGRSLLARARRRLMRAAGRYWAGRYGWSDLGEPERIFERFSLVVNLEQLPRQENRLELTERRDRFGNPLPRLHLRWSDSEQERLERFRRLLSEWLHRAGLGRLRGSAGHRPDLSAHHHAGTTRMGTDARNGVVDPNGRAFGYENLFVAGASVFPTAGFANPTLTIVAMALRLAAEVDQRLG